MRVYHGSIQEIRFPLARVGRPNLDFGQGFYVTDIRVQAERWAERIGLRMAETPKLNTYEFARCATVFMILKNCYILSAMNILQMKSVWNFRGVIHCKC